MSSAGERPAKRVRQACGPCRRKKSRCPGERPVCSYCARLKQLCTYDDETVNNQQNTETVVASTTPARRVSSLSSSSTHTLQLHSNTEKRLSSLETQLARVLTALERPEIDRPQTDIQQPLTPVQISNASHAPSYLLRASASSILPSESSIRMYGQLFMDFCQNQPLPLFCPTNFLESISSRSDEVVLCICALAMRFSANYTMNTTEETVISQYADAARALVMHQIADGIVELSTLQSLCLLCLLDFYYGNTQRASVFSHLVMSFSQSADIAKSCSQQSDATLYDEQLRCFWSVVLLERLHGNVSGAFSISVDEAIVSKYPRSAPRPPLPHRMPSGVASDTGQAYEHVDLGIAAYVIQMTEVWQKVLLWAHRRKSSDLYPPWSSESDYARLLALQMERETLMPYSQHRFKPARFGERSSEELAQYRAYWAPWLLNQVVYHTITCLLNHPLLLSLRLRRFRETPVSEIWLQHTDDLISSHSQWIIHLIDLTDSKSFAVSDPLLAYCVAIVATLFLQQSFVVDQEVQRTKKENFMKCLRFCERVGRFWPSIIKLVQKLQDFENVVVQSFRNSATSQAHDKVYIDLTLFWEILGSSRASEKADENGLVLGSTLAPQHVPSATAEVLDARLLPEPNRVSTASTEVGYNRRESVSQMGGVGNRIMPQVDIIDAADDDFTMLAQSYFAQGEDFVGSLDDWWT